jgi:hypothetical protein
LHSLESEIENSKLLIGDTSDWAGFPKVDVTGQDRIFCSHRDACMKQHVTEAPLHVSWTERLLDASGECGGMLCCDLSWLTEALQIEVQVRDIDPNASITLDFHFLKMPKQHFGIWVGPSAADLLAGHLPATSGHFVDVSLDASQDGVCGIQIGRSVFLFEWLAFPKPAKLSACLAGDRGLHTRDMGGGRIRIVLPAGYGDLVHTFQLKTRP